MCEQDNNFVAGWSNLSMRAFHNDVWDVFSHVCWCLICIWKYFESISMVYTHIILKCSHGVVFCFFSPHKAQRESFASVKIHGLRISRMRLLASATRTGIYNVFLQLTGSMLMSAHNTPSTPSFSSLQTRTEPIKMMWQLVQPWPMRVTWPHPGRWRQERRCLQVALQVTWTESELWGWTRDPIDQLPFGI